MGSCEMRVCVCVCEKEDKWLRQRDKNKPCVHTHTNTHTHTHTHTHTCRPRHGITLNILISAIFLIPRKPFSLFSHVFFHTQTYIDIYISINKCVLTCILCSRLNTSPWKSARSGFIRSVIREVENGSSVS